MRTPKTGLEIALPADRQRAAVGLLLVATLLTLARTCAECGWRWGLIDRMRPRAPQTSIDLNQADWPELTLLPGIGETLARRIVAHRQVRGAFRSVEALDEVHGIGPKTVERVRPLVVLGATESSDLLRIQGDR